MLTQQRGGSTQEKDVGAEETRVQGAWLVIHPLQRLVSTSTLTPAAGQKGWRLPSSAHELLGFRRVQREPGRRPGPHEATVTWLRRR